MVPNFGFTTNINKEQVNLRELVRICLYYMFINICSAALNAYYAQMQMDSIARSSASSPLTTSTPAATSQGQPHILPKATRKRNKGDIGVQHNDAAVSFIHIRIEDL